MRARIGDWIVVESAHLDQPRREGKVVELRHPDGSPPYMVQWLHSGETTLAFPGPDARVLDHSAHEELIARRRKAEQSAAPGNGSQAGRSES
jgi:hypothetical protein